MLPEELRRRIRQIHIYTSHLVNETMAGEYASAFKGRGIEFEEVREYVLGDDVRSIDWKVTARSGKPYVKVYREERELTLMLLVDMSASGLFGSGEKSKREAMAEIGAILAYLASRNNDKVGLLLFTSEVEHYIPPKKGRGHVWRVIQEILAYRPKNRGTNLASALEFAGHLLRKKTVLFVISDFRCKGFERSLLLAKQRHDVTAVRIVDPREMVLPSVGLLQLQDPETDRLFLVDTSSDLVRKTFRERALERERELQQILRRCGVPEVVIRTDKSPILPLIRYFKSRERRR